MYCGLLKSVSRVLSIAVLVSAPIALSAQAAPSAKGNSSDQYASRWDIFAGYSYLAPKGTVNVPQPNGTVEPFSYKAVDVGGLFRADTVLARHDETYMPREVADALKAQGHWQGEQKANAKP